MTFLEWLLAQGFKFAEACEIEENANCAYDDDADNADDVAHAQQLQQDYWDAS